MTSSRWMSEIKPHPLWKFYRKHGASLKYANFYLVSTQFVYTIGTLIPVIPVFGSFEVHSVYLAFIFVCSVWNGANFYFEIFTETYSKRLQRFLKQTIVDQAKEEDAMLNSPTLDEHQTS